MEAVDSRPRWPVPCRYVAHAGATASRSPHACASLAPDVDRVRDRSRSARVVVARALGRARGERRARTTPRSRLGWSPTSAPTRSRDLARVRGGGGAAAGCPRPRGRPPAHVLRRHQPDAEPVPRAGGVPARRRTGRSSSRSTSWVPHAGPADGPGRSPFRSTGRRKVLVGVRHDRLGLPSRRRPHAALTPGRGGVRRRPGDELVIDARWRVDRGRAGATSSRPRARSCSSRSTSGPPSPMPTCSSPTTG